MRKPKFKQQMPVDATHRIEPVEGQPPPVQDAPIAPWPLIDKYPSILGSNLSLQTVSSFCRLAITGYRQAYVDMLDELLEREPHGFSVLSQRVLAVAGGKFIVHPCDIPTDHSEHERAVEICEFVRRIVSGIPDFKQALADLLWGIYYGVSACEIGWSNDGGTWRPSRLFHIHSRRLAYPEAQNWTLHVWDQGMVGDWFNPFAYPTAHLFGVRLEEYPGKFISHTPRLRADYPTRDGLGRVLCWYFSLKAMAIRGASQYIERFGKPWAIAHYATQDTGKPRTADQFDLNKADVAVKGLGMGSLSSAVLPDSVNIELQGPGKGGSIGITHDKYIELINAEISKCVLGQTFTTETGKYGSRATADVGQSGQLRIAKFDADSLCETLKRDLIFWIVKLNFPNDIHLIPRICIEVEDEPGPMTKLELASRAASFGVPVDARAIGRELGLPLVESEYEGEETPMVMRPVSPGPLEANEAELDGQGAPDSKAKASAKSKGKDKAKIEGKQTQASDNDSLDKDE